MSEILTILALVASIFMGISIGASTVASALALLTVRDLLMFLDRLFWQVCLHY